MVLLRQTRRCIYQCLFKAVRKILCAILLLTLIQTMRWSIEIKLEIVSVYYLDKWNVCIYLHHRSQNKPISVCVCHSKTLADVLLFRFSRENGWTEFHGTIPWKNYLLPKCWQAFLGRLQPHSWWSFLWRDFNLKLFLTSLFPSPQKKMSKRVRAGLLSWPWGPVDHMV